MTGDEIITIRGRKVVPGVAEGEALVTTQPISGWGGVDPRNGTVVEMRHELRGQSFAGKVLVFPGAKAAAYAGVAVLRPRPSPQNDLATEMNL